MDVKSKISTSLALCFIGLLFTFAFTWIIFDFENSPNSLKETWTIISGLFSGFATLIAAYIASLLFNDWKVQHNKQILAFEAKKIHLELSGFMRDISEFDQTKVHVSQAYFNASPIHKALDELEAAHFKIMINLLDFMDLSKKEIIKKIVSSNTDLISKQKQLLRSYKKGNERELIQSIKNSCYSLRCNTNALKDLLQTFIFVK